MNPNEIPLPPTPPAGGPPPVPVVTGAPSAPAQPEPSMLDRLRQQVMQDIMPNDTADFQSRLRAFGAGMLGTQGNFFQGLAGGQQAVAAQQQQEQAARANRLKAAEEDAYRQAQIRLKEAEEAFARDPQNPINILRLAQAQQAIAHGRYYETMGQGAAQDLRRQGLMLRARQAALTELTRDPLWTTLDPATQEQRLNARAAQLMPGLETSTPTPTQQANIPTINPAGRPAR